MNLDEQLRAALNLEAEMRTAPPPDVDSVITGGQVRRRRRNAGMAAGGIAVAVLAAGGIFAATQLEGEPGTEPPVSNDPTESASTPPLITEDAEPGTYRVVVGNRPDGSELLAEWTFEDPLDTGDDVRRPHWELDADPVLTSGGDWAGVAVYEPIRLAGGTDPCWDTGSSDVPARSAATTVDGVVRQLARLPFGTVLEQPTSTDAFGRPAVHLRVRIADRCAPGVYHLADAVFGGHGVSYDRGGRAGNGVTLDFLVVDVDGTPVIVEYWHHPGADEDLVAGVTAARDSITFVEEE